MQQIVIHRPGGYDRLTIQDAPSRTPGAGEVKIAVEAIGVNFADCVVRMGLYESARKLVGWPITPGFEVAGKVAALGPGLSNPPVGSDVFAVTQFGGYASEVVVPASQVFPRPEGLDAAQAAGFPTTFLTAYFALFVLAHPRPGESLLVHSAAGGVGGALCQLGRIAGCRVFGVVGSSHKVKTARTCGAEIVIDKSIQDLWKVAEDVSPPGFEVVCDANGPATLRESYRHLKPPGRLVVYGFASILPRGGTGKPSWPRLLWGWLRTPRFHPLSMTSENKSVLAFNLSTLFSRKDLLEEGVGALLRWLGEGRLEPPPVTRYPFGEVARAHRDLESGKTFGKLVLTLPASP